MARRTLLAVVLAAGVAIGCTGSIDEGEQVASLTPAQQLAQSAWLKKALPAIKAGTCNTCHDGSMAPTAPAWLAGDKDLDIRDTAISFIPAVVNLNSPPSSRIVVKGLHEGPALNAPQASDIVTWLQYERDARPPANVIETPQMTPSPCVGVEGGPTCLINTIDLSALGSAGSKIEFYATVIGVDVTFSGFKITAGTGGLHLVHPVFEMWPAAATMPTEDPNDRFFNISLNLAANATLLLGVPTPGETTFASFASAGAPNPVSVKFDELSNKM